MSTWTDHDLNGLENTIRSSEGGEGALANTSDLVGEVRRLRRERDALRGNYRHLVTVAGAVVQERGHHVDRKDQAGLWQQINRLEAATSPEAVRMTLENRCRLCQRSFDEHSDEAICPKAERVEP